MSQKKGSNVFFNVVAVLALVAGLGGVVLGRAAMVAPEEPVSRAYQTACYKTDGGDKWVCASGGEIEIQSGATLDIQSGATTDFSGGMDLDGAELTLDADADTSITADTDDQVDIEISGADDFQFTANTFEVLSGSAMKMNGGVLDLDADDDTSITASTDDQIDVEIAGADLFVLKDWTATALTNTTEYMLEIQDTTGIGQSGANVQAALNIDMGIGNSTAGTNSVYGILVDGIVQDAQNTETALYITNGWDRGIELDGNSLYMDNDNDSYFSELADDSIGFTPGAAAGSLEIRSGNLQVGDGSPGETHDGEDLYVEGISEFDGTAYFDGVVDIDGVLTGADDLEHVFFPSVASTAFTYTAGAGGTVVLFTIGDGEIWIVHDVFVNVTTNFDCTGDDCTVHVGDGGDEDGLCDLDDGELQTTDVEVTGGAAGWQCFGGADTIGAYIASGRAHIYAPSGAAETIDAVLAAAGDDFAAGAATAYVVYTRIQ